MDQTPDIPGVIILPPILLLATIAAGIILDLVVPPGLFASLTRVPRILVGVIVFAIGVSFPIAARRSFHEAGTNIRPNKPTMALITSDLFAHTRNPIYQGASLALLGLAFMLASSWIVVLMVPALIILHYGVVLREIRYLERKFGEAYRLYKASVPRYGWRF
jgi:protein-S-isoprenylcysteine O-methyltransferase Ste14